MSVVLGAEPSVVSEGQTHNVIPSKYEGQTHNVWPSYFEGMTDHADCDSWMLRCGEEYGR